jgi:flavin reductase (DIM6/NTAB) family NADH-FMN oxidoreductase RutF
MFVARVVNVLADESLMDEKGRFRLDKADLICYSHGEYFTLGKKCGSFGFSVRRKR